MGRGRPPKPGTVEEKAAARRERVRNNVRALRERRKIEATLVNNVISADQIKIEWREPRKESEDDNSGKSSGGSVSPTDCTDTSFITSSDSNRGMALLLVCERNGAKVVLPTNLDNKSPYTTALLATMRQNFLPDTIYLPPAINNTAAKPWESEHFLWTPCAFWVTTAFAKASSQETSLLKSCLLAIGMIMKSLEFQDNSLKLMALEMYRRALGGIRKSLDTLMSDKSPAPKDPVSLYLSCHAAAMFELILNSDLSATMQHLRGVSQLICHLGDGRDEDGQSIAWLLLQDYRFAEMALCLKYRYSSYSSIKRYEFEKKTFGRLSLSNRSSSAHGHGSHNLLVKVTDIADRISAIMVKLDSIRSQMHRPDAAVRLRQLLESLNVIWDIFTDLHSKLRSHYGPTFVDEDVGAEGPAPGSFKFKTFDIGAAWCYNLMTQAYCLETSVDAANLLLQLKRSSKSVSPFYSTESNLDDDEVVDILIDDFVSEARVHDLRRLHRVVCIKLTQCLQYFLQADKGITGQALAIFPLDAALGQLDIEMARLELDLQKAERGSNDADEIRMINENLASLADAKDFCGKLQDRAKAFGLPSFAAAGTPAVHSLHGDDMVSGIEPAS